MHIDLDSCHQPKLEGVNDKDKCAGSLGESTSRNQAYSRLMMMIGAINTVRVVVEDPDVKLMLTNILRAGGVFIDDD